MFSCPARKRLITQFKSFKTCPKAMSLTWHRISNDLVYFNQFSQKRLVLLSQSEQFLLLSHSTNTLVLQLGTYIAV